MLTSICLGSIVSSQNCVKPLVAGASAKQGGTRQHSLPDATTKRLLVSWKPLFQVSIVASAADAGVQ